MPNIVSICGTSRPGNYTGMALAIVNDELVRQGVSVTLLDAGDLSLSFPGQPETEDAGKLREAVKEASGVVLATPEYHGGFSAMTKLIIENLGFPSVLRNKPIALLGVAAGRIGAIKSLEQLRAVTSHIGALVLPGSVSIAGVHAAFDEDGNCTDADVEATLRGLATALVEFMKEYVCPKYQLEQMVRDGGPAWTATV
jgi:NAD(P)H-dependent FMN reductase